MPYISLALCVCICVCVCVRQNPSRTSLQCLVGSNILLLANTTGSRCFFVWCSVLPCQCPHKGNVVALQWCSEPLVFSILNSLQKLCVTMAKHPGSFNYPRSLCVGCWNIRNLVEMDGGIKTATVRLEGHLVFVDKKINFLVQEVKRFRMGVVCVSETKWFGSDVY